MTKYLFPLLIALLGATPGQAQDQPLTPGQYEQMKTDGTLPDSYHQWVYDNPLTPAIQPVIQPANMTKGGGGTGGDCNCWKDPDDSWTEILLNQWTSGGGGIGDDGSFGPINLPFQFNLYGQSYSSCHININGNVSFGGPISTYSASAFPISGRSMVAPFWADVDVRNTTSPGRNRVHYKVTANALYVSWHEVGYFNAEIDKFNSFQMIISDGTNMDVGVGSNVSFCYGDMQWTTGSASSGVNGFGGTPATVGANRGSNNDYIQFGRFDHAGDDYDGPFGNSDGISWLDYKNFVFTTSVMSSNIPPIASGTSLCDTVDVCVNELVTLDINFLSPESGQLTEANFDIQPPLGATVTETNSGPANTANIHLQFIPVVGDTGLHTITYTATDNGTPPMTSTVSAVIRVFYVEAPPPFITGDTIACQGQGVVLTSSGGFQHYQWSNGFNDSIVLVGPGTYYVEASTGACIMVSNTVVVEEAPTPQPVIDGVVFNCGNDPAHLSTSESYVSYEWNTGATTPTVDVGSGSYWVTVTNEEGCSGTSPAVNVLAASAPSAYFSSSPNGEVFEGTVVEFTDGSSLSNGTITSWVWAMDSVVVGSGQNLTISFDEPGQYVISLTVTTSDGCAHTYTYTQIVLPNEIIFPNVFSPYNHDNQNDVLAFSGVEYYPNTALTVFNRWGQQIYTSVNYKNTWKPSPDLPEGTYFYILRLFNGKEYTGHVTLVR